MKFYTEFIILSNDVSMPNVTGFCPLLWESTKFDSDGDFYFNYPDNKWFDLEISTFDEEFKSISKLILWVYREDVGTSIGISEAHDLKQYVDKKNSGYFDEKINKNQKVMITSISISTSNTNIYCDYLNTIFEYLRFTNGYIINYLMYDANEFYNEFISPRSPEC